jgi:beta-N-acetylhexosaminidase
MLPHPPPGPARRRLVALCAAAFAALVAGIVVGASGGSGPAKPTAAAAARPPARAVKVAKALPLRRQIGELLMISFPGTTAPEYVRRALRQGRAGGAILFRANAPSPAATRTLTRSLQRAGRGNVLIAADQEGGPIRILAWAAPRLAQGNQPTPEEASRQATFAARDLAAGGVNVSLAPVADVGGQGSVMAGRAFPGGTSDVAALTAAAVRGYRGGKVAATLKHFPGLGEAGANTDDSPVTISSPAAAIRTRDLPAFAAGIKAGAPLVMASHALYSRIDPDNIASQSKPILTTLLRNQLGFKGVVITDSMEAAAVLKRSSIETAALRSIAAGADMLLLTGPGSFPRVSKQLLVAAQRSPRFRARIAEAAARVIALKSSLGLGGLRR